MDMNPWQKDCYCHSANGALYRLRHSPAGCYPNYGGLLGAYRACTDTILHYLRHWQFIFRTSYLFPSLVGFSISYAPTHRCMYILPFPLYLQKWLALSEIVILGPETFVGAFLYLPPWHTKIGARNSKKLFLWHTLISIYSSYQYLNIPIFQYVS